MTPDDYECQKCHASMHVPDGMDPLDEDVRYCSDCMVAEIERLQQGEAFVRNLLLGTFTLAIRATADAAIVSDREITAEYAFSVIGQTIDRLQAIVDRLPKDEIGDPIVPNDTVFWIGEDGFSHKWTPYIATDGRTWYRTRAAAERSRQR